MAFTGLRAGCDDYKWLHFLHELCPNPAGQLKLKPGTALCLPSIPWDKLPPLLWRISYLWAKVFFFFSSTAFKKHNSFRLKKKREWAITAGLKVHEENWKLNLQERFVQSWKQIHTLKDHWVWLQLTLGLFVSFLVHVCISVAVWGYMHSQRVHTETSQASPKHKRMISKTLRWK